MTIFFSSSDASEQFEALVLQGELLWEANRKSESLPVFLRSAQLNPSNWLPFLYLGRYYKSFVERPDAEKARRCFLKSFNLNPRSTEAGTALSDIFREQVLKSISCLCLLVNYPTSSQCYEKYRALQFLQNPAYAVTIVLNEVFSVFTFASSVHIHH